MKTPHLPPLFSPYPKGLNVWFSPLLHHDFDQYTHPQMSFWLGPPTIPVSGNLSDSVAPLLWGASDGVVTVYTYEEVKGLFFCSL